MVRINHWWEMNANNHALIASQHKVSFKINSPKVPQFAQGVPQSAQGVPQSAQGVPQSAQGVPQSAQGVPQSAQGVPQSAQGVPQSAQGVPQFGHSISSLLFLTDLQCHSIRPLNFDIIPHWSPMSLNPPTQFRHYSSLISNVTQSAHSISTLFFTDLQCHSIRPRCF